MNMSVPGGGISQGIEGMVDAITNTTSMSRPYRSLGTGGGKEAATFIAEEQGFGLTMPDLQSTTHDVIALAGSIPAPVLT